MSPELGLQSVPLVSVPAPLMARLQMAQPNDHHSHTDRPARSLRAEDQLTSPLVHLAAIAHATHGGPRPPTAAPRGRLPGCTFPHPHPHIQPTLCFTPRCARVRALPGSRHGEPPRRLQTLSLGWTAGVSPKAERTGLKTPVLFAPLTSDSKAAEI